MLGICIRPVRGREQHNPISSSSSSGGGGGGGGGG
eukprot:CAMPEP_0114346328 /NCGR_PEP_ID=MMETSP0101-20121206/12966_1 /TAXON_ID=38822 ORGANISM="Pteridomonas danica, Strain PT" /NCGR_SAMPLE_ID=MMETSP0101 /ASSEMBLY_ACC=CAM_ASM_000211 /LENGTH=34 /DNA_ID= /DNA_START= /DNA_END= /DNA_ORIENTATION=